MAIPTGTWFCTTCAPKQAATRAPKIESTLARTARLEERRAKLLATAAMERDCVDKRLANPETKRTTTNHIEGIAYTCGLMCGLRVCVQGEGAKSNIGQLADLLLLLAKYNAHMPSLYMIDDACSTIMHLLTELSLLAKGSPTTHEGWCIVAILCMDIMVDGFHFPGHKEPWCQRCLNPVKRRLPEGYNTQVMEQAWARMVRGLGSLNKHGEGRFKLLLYSLTQLRSMWKLDARGGTDNRVFAWKPKKDEHKHKRRSDWNQANKRRRDGKPKKQSRREEPSEAAYTNGLSGQIPRGIRSSPREAS
jgi:hypothetical protein